MMDESAEFDWDKAARTTGATRLQVAFCKAKIAGASNTTAAREAGYSGEGSSLRSVGYQVAHSDKVQSLLALAEAGGAGVADDILTADEAKRILSRMARRGDANAKVRAIQALGQIEEREAVAAAEAVAARGSPEKTLDQIAEIAPVYAMLLAKRHCFLKWTAPEVTLEKARAELADLAELVRSHEAAGANGVDRMTGAGDRASADTPATPGAEATQHAVAD